MTQKELRALAWRINDLPIATTAEVRGDMLYAYSGGVALLLGPNNVWYGITPRTDEELSIIRLHPAECCDLNGGDFAMLLRLGLAAFTEYKLTGRQTND